MLLIRGLFVIEFSAQTLFLTNWPTHVLLSVPHIPAYFTLLSFKNLGLNYVLIICVVYFVTLDTNVGEAEGE
jgi:hypothetical protein